MTVYEILKSQIMNAYPNKYSVNEKELRVIVSNQVSLQVLNTCEFIVYYESPNGVEEETLQHYIIKSLPYNDICYCKGEGSLAIQPEYSNFAEGVEKFNRAMEIFLNFKSVHDLFSNLLRVQEKV